MFTLLAKIYEKQGKYDEAIKICQQAISYGFHDGTKGDFTGRIKRLKKKSSPDYSKPYVKPTNKVKTHQMNTSILNSIQTPPNIQDWGWYISISFSHSTSDNFFKAIFLAKAANYFLETEFKGKKIYQAFYKSNPDDYLKFIQLYELICDWKSCFVMINGKLIDRKIIGGLNYCYGDKCRSGRNDFCFGASFMTKNPFGCHRLQISALNHPWWSFSYVQGRKYIIDKNQIIKRAHEYGTAYKLCPAYNQEFIDSTIAKLPDSITRDQYARLTQGLPIENETIIEKSNSIFKKIFSSHKK